MLSNENKVNKKETEKLVIYRQIKDIETKLKSSELIINKSNLCLLNDEELLNYKKVCKKMIILR